jgi:hypothetical protein
MVSNGLFQGFSDTGSCAAQGCFEPGERNAKYLDNLSPG